MDHRIVFLVLLVGCCGYAFRRGGAPERIVAGALLGAAGLNRLAFWLTSNQFRSLATGTMTIDLLLLSLLLLIAIVAQRFWPIWITGLQGAGLLSHLPTLLPDHVTRFAYAMVLAVWSYPMLLLLVVGTVRHRQRIAAFGSDPSWKPFFARWLRRWRKAGPTD